MKTKVQSITAIIILALIISMIPVGSTVHAAKKLPAPKNVKAKMFCRNGGIWETISWKKVKKAKGYEVQRYHPDTYSVWFSDFTKKKKLTGSFGAAGGVYYHCKLRVRAYKTVNGKKQYGKWSKWIKSTVPQSIYDQFYREKGFKLILDEA